MIRLTQAEMQMAQALAKQRNEGKAQYRKEAGANLNQHLMGLKGEIALARVLDLPIDIIKKPMGDQGVDFIYKGNTLDVKTVEHKYPKLFSNENKIRADIFILAHTKNEWVTFVGWITKQEFIRKHRFLIGKHGKPWYVTPDDLFPLTMLL
jgi:hypothetical protein